MVDEETGAIGAVVSFAFEQEFARTLTDVVMRRTMVGYGRDAGLQAAENIAALGEELGIWTSAEAARQLEAHRAYMSRFLPKALEDSTQAALA